MVPTCFFIFCLLAPLNGPPGVVVPDGMGGAVPFTNSRVMPDGSLRAYDPNLDGVPRGYYIPAPPPLNNFNGDTFTPPPGYYPPPPVEYIPVPPPVRYSPYPLYIPGPGKLWAGPESGLAPRDRMLYPDGYGGYAPPPHYDHRQPHRYQGQQYHAPAPQQWHDPNPSPEHLDTGSVDPAPKVQTPSDHELPKYQPAPIYQQPSKPVPELLPESRCHKFNHKDWRYNTEEDVCATLNHHEPYLR